MRNQAAAGVARCCGRFIAELTSNTQGLDVSIAVSHRVAYIDQVKQSRLAPVGTRYPGKSNTASSGRNVTGLHRRAAKQSYSEFICCLVFIRPICPSLLLFEAAEQQTLELLHICSLVHSLPVPAYTHRHADTVFNCT
jgi:hypothetical protein